MSRVIQYAATLRFSPHARYQLMLRLLMFGGATEVCKFLVTFRL